MRCVSDLIINKWLGNTKENVIKTLLTVKILQGDLALFFSLVWMKLRVDRLSGIMVFRDSVINI